MANTGTVSGGGENDTITATGGRGSDHGSKGTGREPSDRPESGVGGKGNTRTVDGGTGNDEISLNHVNYARYEKTGPGNTGTASGGAGADSLTGGHASNGWQSVEGNLGTFKGGAGNDKLHGGEGNGTLNGGTGDDTLEGGGGDDILHGSAGADFLCGDDVTITAGSRACTGTDTGTDTLYGEDGDDTRNGGGASDLPYPVDTGDGGPGQDTCYINTLDPTCEEGQQALPPTVTVNTNVTVGQDPGHEATVSGTAQCTGGGHAVVRGDLQEQFGFVRGALTSKPFVCDSAQHDWSATVQSTHGRKWTTPGTGIAETTLTDPNGRPLSPAQAHAVTFVKKEQ